MPVLDLWELFCKGSADGLTMGQTEPEEAFEHLGKPSSFDRWGSEGPFNDWFADYPTAEIWFVNTTRKLWRIKAMHPALKRNHLGTFLQRPFPAMQVGQAEVSVDGLDHGHLITLPMALEATRRLGLEVRGSKYPLVKQIDLYAREKEISFSMAYMADDVMDGQTSEVDYYLYGIYVDWRFD